MKPLKVALFLLFLSGIVFAQSLEEQFQAADAELNRVYKELRSNLNEQQKAELKKVQMAWLKEIYKTADQASTPQQRQRFLTQATLERTQALGRALIQVSGTSAPQQKRSLTSDAASQASDAELTPQQRANREHNLATLKNADEELNAVYKEALRLLSPAEQNKLRQDQREWLAQASGGVSFDKHRDLVSAIGLINARTFKLKDIAANKSSRDLKEEKIKFSAEIPESSPVLVTPQESAIKELNSISDSSDGRFVCLAGQNIVEIWSVEDNALLHSLNLPSDFARLLPDQAILLGVGKRVFSSDVTYTGSEMRGSASCLTGVSLLTRQEIFACDLGLKESERIPITKPWRNGYFISRDGTSVVEQYLDSMGGDLQEAFAVCFSPSLSLKTGEAIFRSGSYDPSRNELIGSASNRMSLSQVISRPSEIIKVNDSPNREFRAVSDKEASSRNFDQSSIILDSSISLAQSGDEVILKWPKSDLSWKVPLFKANVTGLATSVNDPKIAIYGGDTIRIANELTLQSKKFTIAGEEILAAAFSPNGQKVAVLSRKKTDEKTPISESQEDNFTYNGTVFDIDASATIRTASVPAELFHKNSSSAMDLRWLGSGIFLSGGAKFDEHFNIVAKIQKCFFPTSRLDPEVLVRADEKPIADESERRKSARSTTIIDPSTLKHIGKVPYDSSDADPTCPDLPPFDIDATYQRILKGWKYWRGGGGIFLVGPEGRRELQTNSDEMPVFCAMSGFDYALTLSPHPDGKRLQASLLPAKESVQSNTSTNAVFDMPMGSAYQMAAGGAAFYGVEGKRFVTKYGIKPNEIKPIVSYLVGDAGAVAITPEHYYLSNGKPYNLVRFTKGLKSYPFEQFDLRLNRPDIVLERLGAPAEAVAIAKQLREKRLKRMGVTEDMLQPDFHLPEIEIVGDLPSSTTESELALKIKASDSKYPLDRLRLYVNNVPVNGKEGELLRDANSQTLERTIPIKLASGRNKIQVSVLNSAGAESLYANAEITCAAQHPKPTLYAIAMGVSEYANPDWNLKYAAKDAKDVAERIRVRSGASYGDLKELLLTDREVTKESLTKIREFLSKATVDDTVLMFVAGHGLLDEKYDYYFGTSDIDFSNPSGKGIAFEEFDDLLAELPCLKKSLLIDTCHAGELDEDEKKALAAAQTAPASTGSSQQVAMHQVGTRGMTIKPIEGARGKSEWYDRLQGLFVDLRRGSGSTILSSSAGAEYALESSEQKNGLFTYAVLEALDGKQGSDANKDGSVTMSELADYVKTRVAALTNNKQTPNVRRVNLEADFALSKK
jgi:uncharacterized protein YecT (DUF1311 family)